VLDSSFLDFGSGVGLDFADFAVAAVVAVVAWLDIELD
jgi:hypothetical protein